MTKLLEWLSGGIVCVSIWAAVLWGNLVTVDDSLRLHVLVSPIYAVIIFGLISLAIVLYRTATFNDCPEACEELKKQIVEARQDLAKKGFKFKEAQKSK
jgi:dolichyl-phosphate mannosyltransferase polypeptide 3